MNNIVEENQRDGSQSIIVEGLSKTYRNSECEPGLGAAIKGFIRKRYQEVEAVKEIFFTVGRGEVVGFIGPNGAGKTTTLKMLSGLFLPSLGTASVLGYLT